MDTNKPTPVDFLRPVCAIRFGSSLPTLYSLAATACACRTMSSLHRHTTLQGLRDSVRALKLRNIRNSGEEVTACLRSRTSHDHVAQAVLYNSKSLRAERPLISTRQKPQLLFDFHRPCPHIHRGLCQANAKSSCGMPCPPGTIQHHKALKLIMCLSLYPRLCRHLPPLQSQRRQSRCPL